MKKLYRSKENRMICGVCAGVAEYFNVDPTIVRLGFAALCIAAGSGLFAYFLFALIVAERPEEPFDSYYDNAETVGYDDEPQQAKRYS